MKKNTSGQTIGAQLVSASNGSAFTGAVTCYVTGDGGTQAAGSVGSGACTHEGNGFHTYAPAQAETNYDHVAFTFIGTGAIPVTVQIYPGFPQTGDNYARLGAPAGASVAADIAAVKSDTAAILTDTGTSGVLISAGTGSGQLDVTSGRIKADLTHILATALDDDIISAVGLTTIAENLSFFFGSNANSTNNVNGYSSIAAIESSTSMIQGTAGAIDAMIQLDGADYEFKASALEEVWNVATRALTDKSGFSLSQAFPANFASLGINASGHVSRVTLADTVTTLTGHTPQTGDSFARIGANGAGLTSLATAAALATVDGILDNVFTAFEVDGAVYRLTTNALEQAPSGGLNATQVADAVWDAVINDHLDAGSTGASLNAAGSAGDPWTTTLPGAYTGSQAGKMLSDILADTGTDGVVIASGQTMEMSATELRAALGMSAADLDSQLDAIVADTNELQTDWVNGGRLDLILDARASQSSVDTVDGILDNIFTGMELDGTVYRWTTNALEQAPAGGGGGSSVSPDVVTPNRTWVANEYRAINIVEVGDNFTGTLALKPDLNPGTTIATVDSVSITGAATVTATDLTVDRSKTVAHFTVPALATTGTYTVVVTVTTVDGQTIPTTATLKVY